MKRCQKCNRTFADDAQKFCTHDGGLLVTDVQPTANFDPNATIITETPETNSPPTMRISPTSQRDLNKTIASTMPPSPPTTDFRHTDTGPAVRPTSANLPPAQSAGPVIPPSSQSSHSSQPLQPPPRAPQPPVSPHLPPGSMSPAPQGVAAPAMAGATAQSAQPARKKSKLPWILGGLLALGVILSGVAAALYFVVMPRFVTNANANTNTNPTENFNVSNANTSASPVENTNAATNQNNAQNEGANANSNAQHTSDANHSIAPFVPPPNSVAFVNSNANLDGKLAEHYVDFSFYYPRSWKTDPKSGVAGASNFVKVERLLPPDYTQEQFAIAWYESGGTIDTDRDKFPKLVETLNNSYKQFPEYRKVSEGDTKINSYDGHEFRFESISRNTDKGDIKLWGRIVFLPPGVAGEKNGLILLMLATSLAPELSSISDVGAKGEMPLILDSFRFGKTQ